MLKELFSKLILAKPDKLAMKQALDFFFNA